jgi:hypothetical protein
MYIKDAGQYGGFACSPIPAAVLHVNEQDRAWVDTMATPHPLATMAEAIQLQGSHLKTRSLFTLSIADMNFLPHRKLGATWQTWLTS